MSQIERQIEMVREQSVIAPDKRLIRHPHFGGERAVIEACPFCGGCHEHRWQDPKPYCPQVGTDFHLLYADDTPIEFERLASVPEDDDM